MPPVPAPVTGPPLRLNERAFEYHERLRRVRDYVEDRLERDVPVAEAARVACLEPSYFSRWFHERVGVPFSTWKRYGQVRRAARVLAERDISVAEAARLVGFPSTRTFERWFKKWLGTTPGAFKAARRPDRASGGPVPRI